MKIRKGQKWYIRLPGGSTICERSILDVTEKTVLLNEFGLAWSLKSVRYVRDEIDFIEEIPKT